MRAFVSLALILFGFALATWPLSGHTQSDRDYVFTDEDGHLVVRFVGTGAAGLDSEQAYEILNAEFSSMVHDRLHADLRFEDEPRDPDWASAMEPRIDAHVKHAGPEFSGIFTECRAASCRVILEQSRHWTVPDHQAVLATVQQSVEAFIANQRHQFQPVFMITAYDQHNQTPHIKVFLRRIGQAPSDPPAGG
jgi:hypothetical protein